MLGLSLEETRVDQEAKEEGRLESKLEMAPLLLEMGLTVEQVAERLVWEVAVVQ